MLAKAGTSRQGQQDHVHKRLEEFVGYFVKAFETKLHLYHMVLEGEIKKAGKLSDKFSDTVGQGVGAAIILAISSYVPPAASLIRSGASLGGKISNALGNKFGAEYNEKKAARLSKLVYFICDNQSSARKILVEAGFNIFQSFEMQFTGVTSKQGVYQQALRYLATDAVNRAISYLMEKEESSIIEKDVISKGVILGESKIEPVFGIPLYSSKLKTAGLKVKYKYGSYKDKRTTADLYEKVGLTIEEGEIRSFYEKKDGKSRVDKYGYRRLLMSESWEDLKQEYKKSDTAVRFTDYQYILSLNDLRKQSENILSKIDLYDNDLSEERIKDRIKELKDELLNFINIFIGSNNEEREILKEIQADLDKLQVEKVFKEIKHLLIGVKERVEQGIQISKQGFHSASQQRYEIAEEIKSLLLKEKDRYIQKNLPERWNIPPKIADHIYIERKHLQDRIEHTLEVENKIIITALHGLGGVGKTQLALDFIQKHEEKYKGVCWFNSKDTDQLLNQYAMLGREQNIFDAEEKINVEEQALRVKNWLENSKQKGWLLVYDNVPNYEAISKFIPTKGGKVIITSRHTEWPQEDIAVGVFDDTEADDYIQKFLPLEIMNQRKELANKLGRLPLALAQACAYIKKNKMNILRYLEIYEGKKIDLLSKETLPPGSKHDPVFITWNVTMDEIERESKLAAKLLTACAYLDSKIPKSLLKMLHKIEKDQSEDQSEVKPFEEVLGILFSYSMLTDDKWENVSIHNLVQDVIRLQSQENEARNLKMVFELLKASLPHGETLEDYSIQRKLLPHFEAYLSHLDDWLARKPEARQKVKVKEDYLQILEFMRDGHSNLGNYKRQKELTERALPILKQHYGPDHVEVAIALVNLGHAYGALGEPEKQKELLEQNALPILEKHYGPNHVEVALVLEHLGNAYGALGKTEKQKELLEKALPILEKYYDSDHVEVARTLVNLGNAYGDLGDSHKQKELLERALPVFQKHYGSDHVEVAIALGNLGTACLALGDHNKAQELLKQALDIKEKHYGPDHVEVAKALGNLGSAYGALGDHNKAQELLKQALDIKEKHYGPDHVEVARTLVNLGNAYGDLGNHHEKKKLLERALRIEEKYYSPDHVEVALTLGNLGTAYGDIGDHHKKKELLERALPILEGNNHPTVSKVKAVLNTLNNEHLEQLLKAVQDNKLEEVKSLVENVSDINAQDVNGATLLCHAVYSGHVNIVDFLLKEGADITKATNNGNTPLYFSVFKGKNEVIEVLLRHAKQLNPIKSNDFVNAKTANKGKTALHVAAEKGNLHVVKLLLKNGAVYNAKNKDNKTPSELTTDNRIKYLFNLVGKLFENVKKGDNQQVVQCLKKEKAIVNARDNDGGGTPLYWAIHNDHMNTARLLLENGADPSLVTNKGNIPLHIASSKGNNDIVRLLLENVKPDKLNNFINAQTTVGKTSALHIASNIEVIRSLLQYGAVYNIKNKEGKTPFDLAKNDDIRKLLSFTNELFEDAKNGNHDIIGKLDNLKVDDFIAVTNARNDQGHTLLQVAIANKHRDVATELSKMLKNPEKAPSSSMESLNVAGPSSRSFGRFH